MGSYKKIDKKKLIEYCNDIKNSVDVASTIKNDGSNGKGVGTNQFRELATVCKSCETFEEIELLIKYKIAKDTKTKDKKTGIWDYSSWRYTGKRNLSIGSAVLDKIKNIRNDYKDDKTMLEALSLFFGYLYQSARVWKSEEQPHIQKTNGSIGKGGKR